MARRKLAANVHVPASGAGTARFFEAGSSPEKEYAEQITNEKAWGESDGNDAASQEPQGYAAQGKADLETEVERRNASRGPEQQIQVGGRGNKPDLVEALEADDEAQA